MHDNRRLDVVLVTDPRFPGGTASAVADEIPVMNGIAQVRFAGIKSRMFGDRPTNPRLKSALASAGIELEWDPPQIRADVIVLHNPAFLKFDAELQARLLCDTLIVVTHENFAASGNVATFDPSAALEKIENAAFARNYLLAPVSAYNRTTVASWLEDQTTDWTLAPSLWPNICEMQTTAPNPAPRDRRGRHSRAGAEKFPPRATLEKLFPAQAEANVILGGDHLKDDEPPAHWDVYPFGGLSLDEFFSKIDFFVYFTNPFWRESFGRVIAEAIAAGKLVITDEGTAEVFGPGVLAANPGDVNALIAAYIADPPSYAQTVGAAQAGLAAFSREAFLDHVRANFAVLGD